MSYKFRILQSHSEFQQLESVWDKLLQKSPADNFFLTWDWVWTWWQTFAKKNDTLAIGLLEYQNNITSIIPCYIRKRRIAGPIKIRTLYFLGTQQSGVGEVCPNYMDFIYSKDNERLLVEKYLEEMAQRKLCDELCLTQMNYDSPIFKLVQEISGKYNFLTLLDVVSECPVIELPATWDEYIQSLSSKMRYKIRHEQRRLLKSQDVVFLQPTNEEEAVRYLDELIILHQKRWQSRNRSGSFADQQFSSFHRKMVSLMFKKNQLSLTILSENKEVKAALYNFRYKNKIYVYQSGVLTGSGLPAYGYLIHSYCIENAIQNKIGIYDFLLKGSLDDYKDRFANSTRKLSQVNLYRGGLMKTIIRLREFLRPFYRMIKNYTRKKAIPEKID